MKGLIIYNPSFVGEGVSNQITSLKAEFKNLGVDVEAVPQDGFTLAFFDGKAVCSLEKSDFIVYLSKDVVAAKLLEKLGYKLFNSAFTIEVCDDKALTYTALEKGGVPFPDTLFAPRLYCGQDGEKYRVEAERALGYPMVIKRTVGSLGSGVYLAETREDLKRAVAEIGSAPHIYQKFFGEKGKDVRVIVIGGKAVAAMERVNDKDFRSNIELGGKGYNRELTPKEREAAEKSAAAVGADYCGVDILTENGNVAVCEVNSNAFFKGISAVTGKNIAKIYAEFIFDAVKGSK